METGRKGLHEQYLNENRSSEKSRKGARAKMAREPIASGD